METDATTVSRKVELASSSTALRKDETSDTFARTQKALTRTVQEKDATDEQVGQVTLKRRGKLERNPSDTSSADDWIN